MRYGVDIDGVLANFTEAWVRVVNKRWPGRLDPNYEPDDWDWSSSGLSEVEIEIVYQDIHSICNFWLVLNPYIQNVAAIVRHMGEYWKDEIFFVTARLETEGFSTMVQTQMWLDACGVKAQGTAVIVSGAKDKSEIFNALECDASIDDRLSAVVQHTRKTEGAYLLDRPWNRSNRPYDIRVVGSVEEFFREVRRGR